MTAPRSTRRPSTTVPLNFRIRPGARALIDRAADLLGKTRTDFMIEAAERRAAEVLLDQNPIVVSPELFAAFVAKLDAPPEPSEALRRTMAARPPWEAR
ncbi:MAG TPA: DUF1778 domain-containing protein [Kaistia sp.]|nr:DUF1778 domain-containing protein [Kaistia sp.]